MKHTLWIGGLMLIMFACFVYGQTEKSDPQIDPEVKKLVLQMSERAKEIKHFEVQVVDTIDEVLDTGQKLQLSHMRTAIVSRPDKLKVDTVGDVTNRSFWKNENTITVLEKEHNVYVQKEFTGTIDEMMDMLLERYGVSMPMADLLSSDVHNTLLKNVQTGQYVGLHHVGEIKCHHLAFTQENIDWQIWIDAGEKPALRKLVIAYKKLPGEPQYSAIFQTIKEISAPGNKLFQFTSPPGSEKIEFLPEGK